MSCCMGFCRFGMPLIVEFVFCYFTARSPVARGRFLARHVFVCLWRALGTALRSSRCIWGATGLVSPV